MNPTTRYLAIGLIGVGLLGAYWVVSAQEGRSLFTPPPAFPTETSEKKGPINLPHKTQPLRNKGKSDATLIVPPEAFETPRPLGVEGSRGFIIEEGPGVVQVQGIAPLPMFPPVEKPDSTAPGGGLPPLPAIELAPTPTPMSIPIVEPTKFLIVESSPKDVPARNPTDLDLALPPPPVLITPLPVTETKKPTGVPSPLPSLPEMKPGALAPPVLSMPAVTGPQPIERPRGFVRIESAANNAAPPPVSVPAGAPSGLDLLPREPLGGAFTLPPPPSVGIDPAGRIGLVQTPSVIAQKHGARMMRAGETQTYQIIVRNLGPGSAHNVRIEDELPAGVRIVSAEPTPTVQANKAVWMLPTVAVNQEQIIRVTLQSPIDADAAGRLHVHVSAAGETTTTVLRPSGPAAPVAVQLAGPASVAVGAAAVFEIRIVNPSNEPIRGLVLFGYLPEGLSHPESQEIKAVLDELVIAPGDTKTLKMPTNAVKAGRFPVSVKIVTRGGEARATTTIDVTASALHLQQAPATRLFLGRDGELRVEVTNHTGRHLRNVDIADRLPEGLMFVGASNAGLYQANTRTVFWHLPELPVGQTQSLLVRVNASKTGQHQNVVFARADGAPETQSSGIIALEGITDVTLRVVDLHNPLELGKDTVYEIAVQNRGSVTATNVGLQIQFPPGLAPKKAEGKTRFSMDRHSVVFEPLTEIGPQGQAIFRVSATALAPGDQRMRFAVVSDQVRQPIEREISTRVLP